jgi:hypothetical protein
VLLGRAGALLPRQDWTATSRNPSLRVFDWSGKIPFAPDFYIGAHAAIAGYRLLTHDIRRYRTYFPTITIIAPLASPDEKAGYADT